MGWNPQERKELIRSFRHADLEKFYKTEWLAGGEFEGEDAASGSVAEAEVFWSH